MRARGERGGRAGERGQRDERHDQPPSVERGTTHVRLLRSIPGGLSRLFDSRRAPPGWEAAAAAVPATAASRRRRRAAVSSSSGGSSTGQRSNAYGQRGWNRQPDGGRAGSGTSPGQRLRQDARPVRARHGRGQRLGVGMRGRLPERNLSAPSRPSGRGTSPRPRRRRAGRSPGRARSAAAPRRARARGA